MEEIIENEYFAIFNALTNAMSNNMFGKWHFHFLSEDMKSHLIEQEIPKQLVKKIKNHERFKGFSDFDLRRLCVHEYSFAITSPDILDVIRKYSPLIDMGAGTGYWSYLLKKMGCDILPIDKYPPREGENEWFSKEWIPIITGEPKILKNYPNRNLFLSWCNHGDSFGANCLKYFKGKHALIITEGMEGVIGNNKFHYLLDHAFKEIEIMDLHHWFGLHDYLGIYERI